MEDVEAPGWSPRDLGTTFNDRRGPVDAAALSSETRAGLWSVSTPGVLRWHIKGEEGGANAQEGRPWSWKRGAGGAHDGRANLSVPPGRSYTPPTRAADAMATARCVAGEGAADEGTNQNSDRPSEPRLSACGKQLGITQSFPRSRRGSTAAMAGTPAHEEALRAFVT